MSVAAAWVMLTRVALTVCLIAASACAPAIDAHINDAALTAAIKTAILNSTDIDGTTVTVRCDAGVVQLGGRQRTADAAAKVVELVRAVQGVRDVQSSIAVDERQP